METEILDQQYNLLSQSTNASERLNLLSLIIEIKADLNNKNYRSPLYQEVRLFLKNYIDAIEDQKSNYYLLDEHKIVSKVNYLELDEQISCLNFLKKHLKKSAIDEHERWLQQLIKDKKVEKLKRKKGLLNKLLLVSQYATLNLRNLILTFLVVIFLFNIILIPAPYEWMGVFKVQYVTYSDYFLLNHFLNCLLYFFDIESDFKVVPSNVFGVLLLTFIKLVVLTLVFKYLADEIKNKFA